MKRLLIFAFIVILPALVFCRDTGFTTIPPAEAHAMMEEGTPILLDVRTRGEYADRHVPGSVLIPLNELSSRLGELSDDKTRDILVICRSGSRSRAASQILVEAGFTSVHNIDRGIIGWERDGFPLEEGD